VKAFRRAARPDVDIAAGERLLAWARSDDGCVIGGTRDAFYAPHRVPWENVEAADWDQDLRVLRISEVGRWGEPRPEHRYTLDSPGRLLQLVRERVTASIVVQRHVLVDGKRGLRVIGRRAPGGDGEVAWFYEYDRGVDPTDPDVHRIATEALTAAKAEVGET